MATPRCPDCSNPIDPADVNVAEGVAYCRACYALSRLGAMVESDAEPLLPDADPSLPPPGCALESDGVRSTFRSSARSLGTFVAAGFFAVFWNTITGVFVLVALGSTLQHALGSIPAWFPSPFSGSSPAMPLGMTIFLWFFLTPFILIGLTMAGAALVAVAGRIEVRVHNERGSVFLGVGPLGWRTRFDALTVRSVTLGRTTWKENNRTKPVIVLKTDAKTLRFGSGLTEPRREWLAAALRTVLVPEQR